MKLLGSLFVDPDDALNVQEGGLGPALTDRRPEHPLPQRGEAAGTAGPHQRLPRQDAASLTQRRRLAGKACRELAGFGGVSNVDLAG